MNPSSTEANGLNLPPPVPEQAPGSLSVNEQNLSNLPEVAASSSEQASQQAAPAMPAIPMPPLDQAQSAGVPMVDPAASAVLPGVADDADLIEKEWVNKAKKIIEQTRNDPYEQSKEITVFKADYMKKRYNKSIKISE